MRIYDGDSRGARRRSRSVVSHAKATLIHELLNNHLEDKMNFEMKMGSVSFTRKDIDAYMSVPYIGEMNLYIYI